MAETLFLLGGSGFLGRRVHAAAERAGLVVVAPGRGPREGGGCDLLDPASLEACLAAAAPDLIVNAAGSPSVAASWERPADAFAANALGALNLLEAASRAAPAAHLLCISSAAVYGRPGPAAMPLGEDRPPAPVSPYGAAKVAMEVLCGQYARSRGLRIAVLRAFNLLGPGMPAFTAASGLARQLARAEAAGEHRVCLALGNPEAARDLVDVGDAAAAVLAAARSRLQGTFNLCSGRAVTVAELAAQLGGASSLTVETRIDPGLARPSDPPMLVGDPTRLREAIGFRATTPLAETLSRLLGGWRQAPPD